MKLTILTSSAFTPKVPFLYLEINHQNLSHCVTKGEICHPTRPQTKVYVVHNLQCQRARLVAMAYSTVVAVLRHTLEVFL